MVDLGTINPHRIQKYRKVGGVTVVYAYPRVYFREECSVKAAYAVIADAMGDTFAAYWDYDSWYSSLAGIRLLRRN